MEVGKTVQSVEKSGEVERAERAEAELEKQVASYAQLREQIDSGDGGPVVVNSPEMEKGNPLFSKLYITHRFQQGYLIYNELLKPIISMHRERE